MKIVSVKFHNNSNLYYFINNNLELKSNDYVIVDTENGMQYARIINNDVKDNLDIPKESMKEVIRLKTDDDYNKFLKNLKDANDAIEYAKKKAKELNLPMKIHNADYSLDRKQLVFNFSADDRVNFRDLAKVLAAKYKTRIELHQIGVRDKSKIIGGLGLCGRELCCSKFLDGMCSISINMAKNQDLALNPSKINGLCGRLLCCLSYEDDVYTEHRKVLPKIGQKIETPDGTGKVVSLDILKKEYTVDIDGELKTYEAKN